MTSDPVFSQSTLGWSQYFINYLIIKYSQSLKSIHRGKLLQILISGTEGGQADLLRELCECYIGQEGHVAEDLVAAIAENPDSIRDHQIEVGSSLKCQ